jgi:uncharacterized protein (DUF433 family)
MFGARRETSSDRCRSERAFSDAGVDDARLITIDRDRRSEQPCIRDLRMTVLDVLEYLASGMSAEEILHDFPDLTLEDIRACLALAAEFPGSSHVRDVGLQTASNSKVWAFAGANGFAIVSKDSDFQQRAMPRGAPPRVVWIRIGN